MAIVGTIVLILSLIVLPILGVALYFYDILREGESRA